jgi:hypothetical protein
MKIFDFKNPRHIQILREEISRAKKMLREYNESDEWNQMPQIYREWLLASADDEMGPDFADEYAETDWMQLPDAITNRIDINSYTLPEKYSKNALANIVEKNKAKIGYGIKLSSGHHDVNKVIDFLKTGNPSRYYAYQVLAILFNKGIAVNMDDLKEQPGYQGTSGAGDQSIIGKWIQADREKGKKSGLD